MRSEELWLQLCTRLDSTALRAVRIALLLGPSVRNQEVLTCSKNSDAVVYASPCFFIHRCSHRQLRTRCIRCLWRIVWGGQLRNAYGVSESGRTHPIPRRSKGGTASARSAVHGRPYCNSAFDGQGM